jgi:hypothetical protein
MGQKTKKIFRKYAIGALLTMALVCNANAGQDKHDCVYPVPDSDSTVLLLGASVAPLVLSQRRKATV